MILTYIALGLSMVSLCLWGMAIHRFLLFERDVQIEQRVRQQIESQYLVNMFHFGYVKGRRDEREHQFVHVSVN